MLFLLYQHFWRPFGRKSGLFDTDPDYQIRYLYRVTYLLPFISFYTLFISRIATVVILALRIWIRIKNILIGSTAYNLIILGYAGGRLHTEGLYAEERGQEAGLHQGNYLCSDGQLSRKREVFFGVFVLDGVSYLRFFCQF